MLSPEGDGISGVTESGTLEHTPGCPHFSGKKVRLVLPCLWVGNYKGP